MIDTNNNDEIPNMVVHTDIFNNVIELIGKVTPSMEAYCNTHSANRCPLSMYGDDFLEATMMQHRLWLHPPPGQERKAIEHYLLCRDKDPTTTSAIIIVPSTGNGIAMPWTPLMRHMVLLKQYVKEDKIFTIGEGRFGT